MCGGSANRRCLPPTVYGDRTSPAASRPPRAIEAALARSVGVAGRAPRARCRARCRRRRPGSCPARGRAAAVAVDVAALDRVGVEHGGPDRQGAAVAEPQGGADPGAEGEVGVLLRRAGSSSTSVRWETQIVQRPARVVELVDAGGDHVVHQPLDLAEVRGPWIRASGRCSATPSTRTPPLRLTQPAPPRAGRGALKPWRRIEVIRSSTTRGSLAGGGAVLGERGQVLEPADGVDHPSGRPAPG